MTVRCTDDGEVVTLRVTPRTAPPGTWRFVAVALQDVPGLMTRQEKAVLEVVDLELPPDVLDDLAQRIDGPVAYLTAVVGEVRDYRWISGPFEGELSP